MILFRPTVARCLIVVIALLVLIACRDEASPVGPDPAVDDLRIANVIFTTPDSVGVAYSHGDHWHGALRVRHGERQSLRVFFVKDNQGSHDTPDAAAWFTLDRHPDYTLRITMDDPTIVRWSGEPHAGFMTGTFLGTTRLLVTVYRDHRALYQAPPVPIVVSE